MNATLEREREAVERDLRSLLPDQPQWPEVLHRAMRYAVLGNGKRLRPVLARVAHRSAGGDTEDIGRAACGLELIHTYSLVHDDLPALDDDVLRRGRETVHVAFDEPTAILVGDALLTEGLLVLARHPRGDAWAARRALAAETVAEAVSSRGMVGGQMEDLEATGQVIAADDEVEPEVRLERIHRHKTGCLLRASVEVGAIWAGADQEGRRSFSRYGECLGFAFQVADDILDVTASAAELGKSPGKDAATAKLTFVTLYGLEAAKKKLRDLEAEMVSLAEAVEGVNGELAELARFVANRRS